jgi:hypothetical protein
MELRMESQHPSFGRCPCSGRYEHRWVEVRMTVAGKVVVLQKVAQGACPLCGSRIYKLQTLDYIDSLMRSGATDGAAALSDG